MGKNDGAIALLVLFGAAFLWNRKGSITEAIVSPFREYSGQYPRDTYVRVMGGPQGFRKISQTGAAGSDEPQTTSTQTGDTGAFGPGTTTRSRSRTYSKTRQEARERLYAPKPADVVNRKGGFGGGGAGVRGSKTTDPFIGVKSRITRVLAPKPIDPGVIPSGTTAGYAEYGQTEALK